MPQEEVTSSIFLSPCKSLRGGLKGLNLAEGAMAEVNINDELAQRKAEEAAARRFQAVEWLRYMDHGAYEILSKEPSEEDFCLALRNGLILCNVLNKVNPGSVSKVVENPVIDVQSTDGGAQSAIQYFENMRNFLVAVGEMQLLTFEASDLEKGGSSNKVVDCILCLKGYHEWKQAGGIGVWKYGGIVRVTSSGRAPNSSLLAEDSEDSFDGLHDSVLPYEKRLLEILQSPTEIFGDEAEIATSLSMFFEKFVLGILHTYLCDLREVGNLPLNAMLIDILLHRVVKYLNDMLVSRSKQLGLLLKDKLGGDNGPLFKEEFIQAISRYLSQRSWDLSRGCIKCSNVWFCGRRRSGSCLNDSQSNGGMKHLDFQREQLEELKMSFHELKLQVQSNQSKWEEELRKLVHHFQGLEVAASSYHKVLEENRLLYNQVQDLKGNIRVYCRVRPFLPGQSAEQSTVDYIGENGSIMIVNPLKQGKEARKIFQFNKVFGTNSTQGQVFADTRPLIRSVLDGYNVCIFAYGQTGSGKTYTMSGPDLSIEETWGVNFRALSDLFQLSKGRTEAISYEVGVQMIEIYNEQVRDLLVSDGSNRRLDIRNNSQQNGLNVPDASLVTVQCTQDVLDLMSLGHKNRAVGATALNVHSSRSHSVLTVHVQGKELVSGSVLRGCLHLVDLAGSERVHKSEAVGDRLKEAQHINRSLSALGDVIAALAQKSAHIPYRNSKLTQVLQDSLGGQAKTLMFVHINPEPNAFGETISTLKFAERVASIELGAAQAHKETGQIRELKEEISNLKLALEKKDAELEQLKSGNLCWSAPRAASPLPIQRCGLGVNLRTEINQNPIDDPRTMEVRSCSSGKQRRSRFPLGVSDGDYKSPSIADERFINSRKTRSPSPPVRRSISTDRGALMRNSKLKLETLEEQPTVKLAIFPKVVINKSIGGMPMLLANENSKGPLAPQDASKQENVSDIFSRLHRPLSRKVYAENEEEQFKLALNIRQGGIRKNKFDSKTKLKYQLPAGIQKSELAVTWASDVDSRGKVDDFAKGDSSENENERAGSPVSSLRAKKLQQNFSRITQKIEPRGSVQAIVEPLTSGKYENKLPIGVGVRGRDGNLSSLPELRRSRSSPRGRLNIL